MDCVAPLSSPRNWDMNEMATDRGRKRSKWRIAWPGAKWATGRCVCGGGASEDGPTGFGAATKCMCAWPRWPLWRSPRASSCSRSWTAALCTRFCVSRSLPTLNPARGCNVTCTRNDSLLPLSLWASSTPCPLPLLLLVWCVVVFFVCREHCCLHLILHLPNVWLEYYFVSWEYRVIFAPQEALIVCPPCRIEFWIHQGNLT